MSCCRIMNMATKVVGTVDFPNVLKTERIIRKENDESSMVKGKGDEEMNREKRIKIRLAASGPIATALIKKIMSGPPVEFMEINPLNTGTAG